MPDSTNYTKYLKYFLFFVIMILAIVILLAGAWFLFRHADNIMAGIRRAMPQRREAIVDPDDLRGAVNPNIHGSSKFGQNQDITAL